MEPLLTLSPQEIQSGIWKTSKASGLLWEEGNNVAFRNNGVSKISGALQVSTPLTDQVRDIEQGYISATGARRVYVGTDIGVDSYQLLAGAWSKTPLYAWPTAGQYADLETWGNWLVMTNGVDPVVVWKNGGVTAALAGTPFSRAKVLKRKEVFLLAFNTDNMGDTGVEWSDESNIEEWVAGRAGNLVVRDLESEVVAVEDLGSRLAVYSRNSLVLGTFVGGTNVWGFKRVLGGIGAISRRSVVSLDPFNYGLTQEGIFKTDGNSFVFVDDPAMQRYIRETADWSRGHLFWGMADSLLRVVTFYFQNIDGAWRQVSYYPDRGFFIKGDLQLTAGDRKKVFDHPFVVSEDLKLGQWQASTQHFGQDIGWNLKTKPLDFGRADRMKLVNLVKVDGNWDAEVKLRVQVLEHPEDAAPKTVIDKNLIVDNYFKRDGRYFTLEFYGEAPWEITGIRIYGTVTGVGL